MKFVTLFISASLFYLFANANVALPVIFSQGMVLQRDTHINVWGQANANEKITVSFNKQIKHTVSNKNGEWNIQLDAEQAGGPYTLVVKGNNTITIKDVLVGEVWVCSGQSNMEFELKRSMNAKEEIRNANYPQIRQLAVKQNASLDAEKNISPTQWESCTPETAGRFSAVAYFFSRKLQQELNVPIGLINATWGGTNAKAWVSRNALYSYKDFDSVIAKQKDRNNNEYRKRILETVRNFQNGDISNNTQVWKDQAYNDKAWSTIITRKQWKEQGLSDVKGTVWYRKEITLSIEQSQKEALLELPSINSIDETFINGVLVGKLPENTRPTSPRKYTVPIGVLKEGKNVIAIKITDLNGSGGIVGKTNNLQLSIPGEAPVLLEGQWRARVDTSSLSYQVDPSNIPSSIFNGMINPVIPYTIKGVIWYQGEANANRAYQYQTLFPLLIKDWRHHWKEGDFPFYFVQLTSYNAHNQNGLTGSNWAELREAQTKALALPNTGMAVTIDVGEAKNIHPANKQDVGLRLAFNALNKTYGKKNITPCGPLYKSMKVEGNKIIIEFTETGKGLMSKDSSGKLNLFAIAGADKQFKWASAYIENNKIVVFNQDVSHPVAVRYAWVDNALDANLYSKDGLPASPFRTDSWEEITKDRKDGEL